MVIHRTFDEIFRTWSNIAVMRALLDTKSGASGNEVARLSGMNPRSAFKALTLLEELGLVNRQIGGRDHLFTLNRENYFVQEAIIKLFEVEDNFRKEIFKSLETILKKRVYSAVIFGSTARKEENVLSDLDICCIVNSNTDKLFIRDAINKKSQLLKKKFGVKPSPVLFTKSEFVKKRKTQLVRSIVSEAALITGKHPRSLING